MVYYCKELKKQNVPSSFDLFATSRDKYLSLFSHPKEYFRHRVLYDHMGAQFMTDNFDLVLRVGSVLNKKEKINCAKFHHYAKDINSEVSIKNGQNVAVHNNEKILFIYNIVSEQCESLYDKMIRLQKVL
jgi:hypothetical protein